MTRLRRSTVALISALLVGGMVWMGSVTATADELSDAKDRLTTLQGEASQASDRYNEVRAERDAAKSKLAQVRADIDVQHQTVRTLRDQIALVSLQQFQDRGIMSTATLLISADRNEALNRIVVTSMVADTQAALLQNSQLSQATLEEMERDLAAIVASIAAKEALLEELKEQAEQKVAEAEVIVSRLTAQQRAGLGWGEYIGSYFPPPPVQNGAAAAAVVSWAMARVGLPYVYGGSGPNGYDCSGFTMMAFAAVGISLPHGSASQFNYGAPVAKSDLQPGDLVFFYSGPGHVGIYVGGGMIVDARNERTGVVYTSIDTGMPYVGARRLL
jgi:cell wall-associated NlpC family hydrolase